MKHDTCSDENIKMYCDKSMRKDNFSYNIDMDLLNIVDKLLQNACITNK
jgi:hypothetical protein